MSEARKRPPHSRGPVELRAEINDFVDKALLANRISASSSQQQQHTNARTPSRTNQSRLGANNASGRLTPLVRSTANAFSPPSLSDQKESAISQQPRDVLAAAMVDLLGNSDRCRNATKRAHNEIVDEARGVVLERRRAKAGRELNRILKGVFDTAQKDNPLLLGHKGGKGAPSTMVPSINELVHMMDEEGKSISKREMVARRRLWATPLEGTSESDNPSLPSLQEPNRSSSKEPVMTFEEHMAKKVRWLIGELGQVQEENELKEEQYRQLLIHFAAAEEEAYDAQCKRNEAQVAEKDAMAMLLDEKKRHEDTADRLNFQIRGLREKLFAALEAQIQSPAARQVAATESPLPEKWKPPPKVTPKKAVKLKSDETPIKPKRVESDAGIVESPTLVASPTMSKSVVIKDEGAVSFEEKENLLRQLVAMRKEVDDAKRESSILGDKVIIATNETEKVRSTIATIKRNCDAETSNLKKMLVSLRDAHAEETAQLERQLVQAQYQVQIYESTVHELHSELRDVSSRMLTLQNMFLSGPSIQTLLYKTVVKEEDQEVAAEEIDRMTNAITKAAQQWIDAEDVVDAEKLLQRSERKRQKEMERQKALAAREEQLRALEQERNQQRAELKIQEVTPSPDRHDGEKPQLSMEKVVVRPNDENKPAADDGEMNDPQMVADEPKKGESDSITHFPGKVDTVESPQSLPTTNHSDPPPSQLAAKEQLLPPVPSLTETHQPSSSLVERTPHTVASVSSELTRPTMSAQGTQTDTASLAAATQVDKQHTQAPPMASILPPPDQANTSFICERCRSSEVLQKQQNDQQHKDMQRQLSESVSPAPTAAIASVHEEKETDSTCDTPPASPVATSPNPKKSSGAKSTKTDRKKAQSPKQKPSASAPDDAKKEAFHPPAEEKAYEEDGEKALVIDKPVSKVAKIVLPDNLSAMNEFETFQQMSALRDQANAALDEARDAKVFMSKVVAEKDSLQKQLVQSRVETDRLKEALAEESALRQAEREEHSSSSTHIAALNRSIRQLEEEALEVQKSHDEEVTVLHNDIIQLRQEVQALSLSDLRAILKNKERMYIEGTERILRAVMSNHATASCGVCLDLVSNALVLAPCGHVVCRNCFIDTNKQRGIHFAMIAEKLECVVSRHPDPATGDLQETTVKDEDGDANEHQFTVYPNGPVSETTQRLHNRLRSDEGVAARNYDSFQALALATSVAQTKSIRTCCYFCDECNDFTVRSYVHVSRIDELVKGIEFLQGTIRDSRNGIVQQLLQMEGSKQTPAQVFDKVKDSTAFDADGDKGTDLERDARTFLFDDE